ncbi:hypothetical protein PFICI_02165 [Pestalotiopsis fici W106-1]|uniref:Major facilitator superfamily (MFS) profile domain-containing protein n=1 Tax=Pestalotiopsis fici (strain W106-1 / CGMCC3.15140) TaxID=1229662 RepID=W3XDL0_PESFW|nr:uncharacterized protein PFICI_02165 [Pestalotiopsis fici W106-1]ETS84140.1 hypothetical protein PFICI_02165 [Pestalotiopsis fici W106-1]
MASHLTQPAPKAGETAIIEPKPESAMYIDASRTELSVDWSAAEELRAIRKVDFFILPLVMMGFFSLQIDRGNISAALTSGMRTDLNITQNTISNGQTILYLCILLGELPSNLVLQRVGAKFWLPCQMIVWELVATIQCVITNQTGFYVCRAFLGLAESGFIPGGVYYISTLSTRQEFAKRVGLFWIGNYIGKGCSGLIAAGVLSLGDVRGFATWQWLFFIEGMMTLFIGVLNLFFFPRSTEDSRTLIPGLCILTNRQEYILTTRLLVDNPSKKDAQKIKISLQDVAKALSNWRIYLILVFALAWTAPVSTLETYNAQIVTSLGFSTIKGNALSSVGYWAQIPIIFICGWFASDRFDIRGVVIFCTAIPFIAFSAAFYYLETLDNVYIWIKYAIFQMMVAFTGSSCKDHIPIIVQCANGLEA